MDRTRRFIFAIISAVVLCKHSQAEWNATKAPANRTVSCEHHANSSNCTDSKDEQKWSGHFSACPKEYKHFCIHGVCRFIEEQNTPSCRCEKGYIGSRCEYLDIDFHVGERRKIVIACVVAGLVFLILLIIFICVCTHKRYRPCRKKKRKKQTIDEDDKHTPLNAHEGVPADTSNTNAVWTIQWSDPAWLGNGLEMRTSSGEWWKQRFTVILSGLSMNSGDMVCQATFAIPSATVYLILHATLFMLSSRKGSHCFTMALNVKAYHYWKKYEEVVCNMLNTNKVCLSWLRCVYFAYETQVMKQSYSTLDLVRLNN